MTTIKTSKLFSALLIVITLGVCIIPNSSCSQSDKTTSLDGKNFTIVSMETGKPETATISNISFSNGMFDDEICHIYGFVAGKYTASKEGDNYHFESTITSPTEGTETYKGMVMGDKIHGEVVWRKEGQADITYAFSNMGHTMTSLDGKTFVREVMMGDSTVTEEISFVKGKFESPLCYQFGFSASTYSAWEMDGKTMWQSLYNGEKEGWILFTGSLEGNILSGSQYWHKDGQADMIENFKGPLKM